MGKFIHDDVVSFYLKKQNPNLKLSIKKLSKILNISKSQTYYLAMNSPDLRMVKPLEVGSDKKKVYVVTYCKNNPERKDKKMKTNKEIAIE